jgi:hypothetical protein
MRNLGLCLLVAQKNDQRYDRLKADILLTAYVKKGMQPVTFQLSVQKSACE